MTSIRIAEEIEQDLLHRIDQFYLYEFSKYMPESYKLDEDGVFQDGDYLDYWADPNKFPYLIYEANEIAGFALVRGQDQQFNLDQFFVMLKFQGTGTSARAAALLFDQHPGFWELHSLKNNSKSEGFWPKVVGEYSNSSYNKSSFSPKHTHFVYTFRSGK